MFEEYFRAHGEFPTPEPKLEQKINNLNEYRFISKFQIKKYSSQKYAPSGSREAFQEFMESSQSDSIT
jgi:hypothetical protein